MSDNKRMITHYVGDRCPGGHRNDPMEQREAQVTKVKYDKERIDNLKPYMAYSRAAGSHVSALLVYANNLREAKRIAWRNCGPITDEYIDLAVCYLKDSEFLLEQAGVWAKDKYASGQPFVVASPRVCDRCALWGYRLDTKGVCENCTAEEELDKEADERLPDSEALVAAWKKANAAQQEANAAWEKANARACRDAVERVLKMPKEPDHA